MPSGICKLCLKRKELQNSHFYPRGLYKALMDLGERNPNPVQLTSTILVQKSKHIKDYVLCWDCEQILSRKGENWALRKAFNGTRFPLRELVLKCQPVSGTDDSRMIAYAGGEIPGMDMGKLVYFGISLFWRASVHKWHLLDGIIHAPLGKYEEPFRRYLLGAAPLPGDVSICALVSPNKQPWRSFFMGSPLVNEGSTRNSVIVAGLSFRVQMGNLAAVDLEWCSYHSARKYIFTSTTIDDVNAFITLSTYLKQSGLDAQASVRLVP